MTHRPELETVTMEPHLILLFGATGDLSQRSLLPALYRLFERRDFSDTTHVIGIANRRIDDETFRQLAREAIIRSGVPPDTAAHWCAANLSYHTVADGFDLLVKRIEAIESRSGLTGNRAIYLAIPPTEVAATVESLAGAGLNDGPGWTRIVVEKPFGTDLASAQRLNELLHRHFDESQIYRIDHFLAKETVQNLLVFRLANPLFESSWNRDRIDSVQITVSETLGLEGRAGYFDQAGLIRDMLQNHLMQVLTLVAMEAPVRMESEAIRDEKVKVLRSIYPVAPPQVVRGRYAGGVVEGRKVPGYLAEDAIDPSSRTETYAALRIEIDSWRWKGVPFFLRSGKRLPERLTQVTVIFKEPPVCLFDQDGWCPVHPNILYVTLQPHEGFDLMFDVKTPGEGFDLQTWPLAFRYGQAFGSLPSAYETLLADLLVGDQTLFVRADEAEEAWRILGKVLDAPDQPHDYPAGSWGPPEADRLLDDRGGWRIRPPTPPEALR